jgi:hypothetical protein
VPPESITLKQKTDDTYIATYSGTNSSVQIKVDKGSIVDVSFSSTKKSPISAKDLRDFPLWAVEILIKNTENAKPTKSRKTLKHPNGALTETFMKDLSAYYLDALTRNERPLVAIAASTGAPHNTVARWVLKARKEGFLK